MLLLACLILAASPLLTVLPDQRVAVRGMEGVVLPPTCQSREIFGINCPGCGLTRSFVYLAHGNWEESLRVHRIGWALMALAVLQVPYRLHAIYGSGRYALGSRAASGFAIVLVALLIANWLFGLIVRGS
jgi:hypothetical protein